MMECMTKGCNNQITYEGIWCESCLTEIGNFIESHPFAPMTPVNKVDTLMIKYTRDGLISICEDAVVHYSKWGNRDSYSAQMEIASIYEGLTAGLEFEIDEKSDEETILIDFINVDLEKLDNAQYLTICDIDDYFKNCDPDHNSEMFEGRGIDFYSDYTSGFMPTRERLEEVGEGEDWY